MDKAIYWERRKKGLRGQGEYPNTVVAIHQTVDWEKKPKSKTRAKYETNSAGSVKVKSQ